MAGPDGYWIGHVGALLGLPNLEGGLTRKTERAAAYATSASGRRRVYLAARRAPLREWSVTIPNTRADEAATLHGLLLGTDPPYTWVDPWSRVTNLLSPAAAGLTSSTPSLPKLGRQPLVGGGFAATAAANPGGGTVRIEPAPVADLPVTVSAYLAAPTNGRVSAVFLDSNGAAVGPTATSASVTAVAALRRIHVTATPPVGAAAVELRITGATVIARPCVTWTSALLEYGAGGGAAQVVVTGLDETIDAASDLLGGLRRSGLSFTVLEVG